MWHKAYTPWLEDKEIQVLLDEYKLRWEKFNKLPEEQ